MSQGGDPLTDFLRRITYQLLSCAFILVGASFAPGIISRIAQVTGAIFFVVAFAAAIFLGSRRPGKESVWLAVASVAGTALIAWAASR